MCTLNGMGGIETPEFLLSKIADFGTPDAYNHYAVGWAHALCTPYQWTKQVASHWGGTRNGTIVHLPTGLSDRGTTRAQFHHVIDIVPTIYEVTKITPPAVPGRWRQVTIPAQRTSASLPRSRRAVADR